MRKGPSACRNGLLLTAVVKPRVCNASTSNRTHPKPASAIWLRHHEIQKPVNICHQNDPPHVLYFTHVEEKTKNTDKPSLTDEEKAALTVIGRMRNRIRTEKVSPERRKAISEKARLAGLEVRRANSRKRKEEKDGKVEAIRP